MPRRYNPNRLRNAINRYNSRVREHNRRVRKAISDYNREVQRHNAQARANRYFVVCTCGFEGTFVHPVACCPRCGGPVEGL